jgi:hypothetical protein
LMNSLPPPEDCTLVLLQKPYSTLSASVQLSKTYSYQSCAHSGPQPPLKNKN